MPLTTSSEATRVTFTHLDHQGETIRVSFPLGLTLADGSNYPAIRAAVAALDSALDAATTSNPTRSSLTTYSQSGPRIPSTDTDSDDAQWVVLLCGEDPSASPHDPTARYQITVKSPDGAISAAADGDNNVPLSTPLLSGLVSAIEANCRGRFTNAPLVVLRATKN